MKKKILFVFCACSFLSFIGSSCFDTDVPNTTPEPPPASNVSGILLATNNSGEFWTRNYIDIGTTSESRRSITGVTSFSSDPDSLCIISGEKNVWKRSGFLSNRWGISVYSPLNGELTDIEKIPSTYNEGIVIGQYSSASGQVALTNNDGVTWVENRYSTTGEFSGLRAIDFDNSMRGLIIPELPDDSTYKTFNGGYTWIASQPVPGINYKNDVSYYGSNNETHPVVCGNLGSIYRINFPFDTNWVGTSSGTQENLNGIDFSGLVGIIVGDRGTILRTEDGGESWEAVPSGVTKNLKKVKFHLNFLLAVGDNVILRSTDYGLTWITARNEPKEFYYDIYLFQPYGIVVGGILD